MEGFALEPARIRAHGQLRYLHASHRLNEQFKAPVEEVLRCCPPLVVSFTGRYLPFFIRLKFPHRS